jgi:hypothetical protein
VDQLFSLTPKQPEDRNAQRSLVFQKKIGDLGKLYCQVKVPDCIVIVVRQQKKRDPRATMAKKMTI